MQVMRSGTIGAVCLALCAWFPSAVQAAEPAPTVVIAEDDGHPYPDREERWNELFQQSKERAAVELALARDRRAEAVADARKASTAAADRFKAAERDYRAKRSLDSLERMVLAKADRDVAKLAIRPVEVMAFVYFTAESESIEHARRFGMWPHNARLNAERDWGSLACIDASMTVAQGIADESLGRLAAAVAVAKADVDSDFAIYRRDLGALYGNEAQKRIAYERADALYRSSPDPVRKSLAEQAKIQWDLAAGERRTKARDVRWAYLSATRDMPRTVRKSLDALRIEAEAALGRALDPLPPQCLVN